MRAHIEANFAAPAVARRTIEAYETAMVQTRSRPRPAAPWAQAAGVERPPFRLPLVVALARGQAIDRVGALPAALRDRLTIITSPRGRYADDRDLPLWGDWLQLDQEGFYRAALEALERDGTASKGGLGRLRSALGGPTMEGRRRDLAARRDEIRLDGIQRFAVAAIGRIARPPAGPGAPEEPIWIVALDADDIVLAARWGPNVGRVAPGGVRWLADSWDAATRQS